MLEGSDIDAEEEGSEEEDEVDTADDARDDERVSDAKNDASENDNSDVDEGAKEELDDNTDKSGAASAPLKSSSLIREDVESDVCADTAEDVVLRSTKYATKRFSPATSLT